MPVIDKPLEELKTYMGSSPCPDDMDRFWDDGVADTEELLQYGTVTTEPSIGPTGTIFRFK